MLQNFKILQDKVHHEFYQLKIYATEMDRLITTLHDAEHSMLEKISHNPDLNFAGINIPVKNEKGEFYKEGLDILNYVLDTIRNKKSLTGNYWFIMRVSTLAYATSIFDGFLQELLILLFKNCPQALISSKPISLERIIKSNNIEILKDELINEKAAEIAYQSLKDQLKLINEKFRVSLNENNFNHLDTLIEIYETRNLHIHNKGIVNNIYISKVSNPKYMIGDLRDIDKEYLITSIELLQLAADQLSENSIKEGAEKAK
ncbi:hypothetical protein MKQ70_30500 [Chitinophaga sedimenti]|uniref:hypothetical protein n=1 Tax=Chitinophaga sedimenti TaxID=2033606 RepID=UPI0020037FAB|nr:hypothetical protein [Chitinophaga sedimenti]MCK7559075.1 hypothetical protein [Chitinophaga sedimenti]